MPSPELLFIGWPSLNFLNLPLLDFRGLLKKQRCVMSELNYNHGQKSWDS